MNERSFIVKSYFAIPYIFSCFRESSGPRDSGEANHPAIARVLVASDRGDARAKHVTAVNFKISYPTLSPQRDATQPARVALVNRSRRMDPASVVRQIERWRRPRSKCT